MSKTKIQSVTVVSGEGVKCYSIGQEVNGLTLHEIQDIGMECHDAVFSGYLGKTEGGNFVFCVENAPVDVEYYLPEPTDWKGKTRC